MSSNSYEIDKVIKALKRTQNKSNAYEEFERALNDAFDFLGFETELLGGSGDTDVLLSANIGKESFKVTVDGKTSSKGKISERQIDWLSLSDHKKKNNADYTMIVGPEFAGGNLEKRAEDNNIGLLKVDELVELIKTHKKFPFTLVELKDLIGGESTSMKNQINDLLAQNNQRINSLKQFKIILEEMISSQDDLGYFTFESIVRGNKIRNTNIDYQDIKGLIKLLNLPFINCIKEIGDERYILTMNIEDISNIFEKISKHLYSREISSSEVEEEMDEELIEEGEEDEYGTKYFEWSIEKDSVVAKARKEDPYDHFCPINHFETILNHIKKAFEGQEVIRNKTIFNSLEGEELTKDRLFKGRNEEYKIRMALGILELEGLIKWTGSKRPIEYKLNVSMEELDKKINKLFGEKVGRKISDKTELDKYINDYSIICSCGKTFDSQQQSKVMRDYVDHLIERHELLENIEIPYVPGSKNSLINKEPRHPNGEEMKGAHELSNGLYLFTALNKHQKKKYMSLLAERAGCNMEFEGRWTQ